jgi:hypothetical protein
MPSPTMSPSSANPNHNGVRNSTEEEKPQIVPRNNDNSNPQQGTGTGTGNLVGSSPSIEVGESVEKRFEQVSNEAPPPPLAATDGVAASRVPVPVPTARRDARKLFVGGLPTDITHEEFHTFFAQFGTIVDSVVMFDRETRRSRGFGFVTFLDPVSKVK